MELSEFVTDTLVQITGGVKKAQEIVRKQGGYVNPAARVLPKASDQAHLTNIEDGQNVFVVDFNVGVTVTEEKGKEASAKLNVASLLNIGGGGKSEASSVAVNQISFKVPLALPVDEASRSKLLAQEQRSRTQIEKHNRSLEPENY